MSATVTLEIINGPLQGKTFEFSERTRSVVGRGSDCSIAVPETHSFVSRHHCAIEISPPQISVRDIGSLHGTYVNQKCIGQRQKGMTPQEGARVPQADYPMSHRDELQLGVERDFKMRVLLFETAHCAQCATPLPGLNRFEPAKDGEFMCKQCQNQENTKLQSLRGTGTSHCPVCGQDAPVPTGRRTDERIVCSKCHANPDAMIRHLLAQADIMTGLNAIRDYELLQKIGKGGFGAVFLARHRRTNQKVALKVMLPDIAADAGGRLRFEREIENTRALNHPNVVSLFEEGRAHGIYFFTMGYCEAGNVSDLMKRRGGTLPVDEALFLMFQVLDGLHYAHYAPIPRVRLADGSYGPGVGLVHRDIKPCNLLLDGYGKSRVVKVSDYGMAKAFDKAGLTGITRPGSFAGSFHFMPRQQILEFGESLPEVDVWAATASLYYMLTGSPPRDFPPNVDPHAVVLQNAAVLIRQRNPALPKRLAKVIDEALVDYPAIGIRDIATLKKRLKGVV
ncbi:serine/threonine-protein kinase PrkC [Abditibacteriota bacterium]|nr:serine/threonine-protein kinase PrkC [Abditibacteriota bacterium]